MVNWLFKLSEKYKHTKITKRPLWVSLCHEATDNERFLKRDNTQTTRGVSPLRYSNCA